MSLKVRGLNPTSLGKGTLEVEVLPGLKDKDHKTEISGDQSGMATETRILSLLLCSYAVGRAPSKAESRVSPKDGRHPCENIFSWILRLNQNEL